MRRNRPRRPPWSHLGVMLRVSLMMAVVLVPGCSEGGSSPVQLVAASSLGELAGALAEAYQSRTGQVVSVRLAASSTLSRQLMLGAPGDVFLSADPDWVDPLPTLARRQWLGNRLVWVVPADGPDVRPEDVTSLALGARGVPVGRYAVDALAARGLSLPERVVRGSDARATLAIVANGGVQAGVVYATDAALEPGVRVIEQLADSAGRPVRYVAAVLRPGGSALYAALDEPWARQLASDLGFVVLP